MFQLTKRTEYGLIALTHLASARGEVTSAREITERYSLPQRLLAEVLKDLCKADLVTSHRGANGGYSIAQTTEEISIGDVVRILEEGPLVAICESPPVAAAGPAAAVTTSSKASASQAAAPKGSTKTCELESTCPIRSPIHRLHTGLWNLLDQTALGDLTRPPHSVPLTALPGE